MFVNQYRVNSIFDFIYPGIAGAHLQLERVVHIPRQCLQATLTFDFYSAVNRDFDSGNIAAQFVKFNPHIQVLWSFVAAPMRQARQARQVCNRKRLVQGHAPGDEIIELRNPDVLGEQNRSMIVVVKSSVKNNAVFRLSKPLSVAGTAGAEAILPTPGRDG
jgi:hypothetical protein